MPNHCTNDLEITGTMANLKKLMAAAEVDQWGSLGGIIPHFIPMPEIFLKFEEMGISSQGIGIGNHTLGRYIDQGEGQKARFEPLVGKELEDILEQTDGFHYWYDWCSAHWGTKWGDYEGYSDFDPDDHPENYPADDEIYTLFYSHQSAWGPCLEGWKRISEMLDLDIFIDYYEEGNGFRGQFRCVNGKVLLDKSWDMGPEDFLELFDMTEDEYMYGEEYCEDGVYRGDEWAEEYDRKRREEWEKKQAERETAKGGDA